MKLFNAHKFELQVLDDELTDPEELLCWIMEAVAIHCEVRCVMGEVLDSKESIMSLDGFEFADAN